MREMYPTSDRDYYVNVWFYPKLYKAKGKWADNGIRYGYPTHKHKCIKLAEQYTKDDKNKKLLYRLKIRLKGPKA